MLTGRRLPIAVVTTLLSFFTLSEVRQYLAPSGSNSSEAREELSWIASSHSCGTWIGETKNEQKSQEPRGGAADTDGDADLASYWISGKPKPEDWSGDERVLREIPQYVLDHAPYVHLFSGENFWPCDIAEHLIHTTPHLNYTPAYSRPYHPNLTNLDELNDYGRFVYLKSDDNVEERPRWLGGSKNIPSNPDSSDSHEDDEVWIDWDGRIDGKNEHEQGYRNEGWYDAGLGDTKDRGSIRPDPATEEGAASTDTGEGEELLDRERRWSVSRRATGGRSDAPAVLIVINKGNGIVDAFWFYFYSYNLGNVVLNVRFGNHVGDWEHSVVRFQHGVPKAVFLSEHNFGEAYSYQAVEKIGKRPVIYSATGTHAMYAVPGSHPYVLPWGLLHDETDRGPLWDPLLNSHSYTYDHVNDTLRASNHTPLAPTNWFYFNGHWGDKSYPLSDSRQYRFAGQYHYVNGPLGPRFKNLGRKRVCQGNEQCVIKHWLGGEGRTRRWKGVGRGEEMTEEDRRRFVVVDEDGGVP
ncbi:hypothetical protein B0A49_08119 [Cryomyces minteri]|uniref:Vacuolar protein sorting-associated protein 62 n=1 Tax=Cryomyces minteri TaxID=331657 RepID=A0A4U0WVR6_9PEZI|nr:hypothetical protein B0A49_08119 [Cryomyces minteri]